MEQLKKALAKSRVQGSSVEKTETYDWSTSTQKKPKLADASELNIAYEQTRVLELDRETLEANRVLCGAETAEVEQAYKLLRTQVLQRLTINEWNSFAVVSPGAGNGKSLTALNLAISLAREVKQSVLLVDLDFRSPKLAKYLGIDLQHDIGDYLLKGEALNNVLVNPGLERLVLLGNQTELNHSSEILGSPRLIRLVEELKSRYQNRIVIFDLPPMLEYDDAIAFLPNVDSVLMVVEEGRTSPEDLARCADQLLDKPLLGTVLNKGID